MTCHTGSPPTPRSETSTLIPSLPPTLARRCSSRSSIGPILCPGVRGDDKEPEVGGSGLSLSLSMIPSKADARECNTATTKSPDLMVGANAQVEVVGSEVEGEAKLRGAGELRWLGVGVGDNQGFRELANVGGASLEPEALSNHSREEA